MDRSGGKGHAGQPAPAFTRCAQRARYRPDRRHGGGSACRRQPAGVSGIPERRHHSPREDRHMNKDIFVVDGARTPFGSFGGSFKDVSAIDLGTSAATAAIERSGYSPNEIDQVFFGNVIQTSADAIYMARHVGLKAGIPEEVPALTVNRLCGSGLQAMISGAQSMLLDEADTALAGGAENMSQAPYVVRGARWGLRMGNSEFQDYLWEALTDPFCGCDMANTAENLAEQYGISRQAVDEYALRSQHGAAASQERCYFTAEIVPVDRKSGV